MFYHQLPARSPIAASALPRLTLQPFAVGIDPREELRALLRDRYHADGVRCFASGCESLQAAFEAVKLHNDSPVLVPAYTCYEVATAAVGADVRVALYDVDPDTLEPDWDSVRAAAADGAAALVVAPLYGLSSDFELARTIANTAGALLIADVAQGFGATWNGQALGSSADFTVLSFGRGKGWTGAGGGALLWRGPIANSLIKQADTQSGQVGFGGETKLIAKAAVQWALGRSSTYALPAAIPFLRLGETVYHDPTELSQMTRASAALLLATRSEALEEVLRRRVNARVYAEWLGEPSGQLHSVPGARLNDESGGLRFPVRIKHGWTALQNTSAPRMGVAPGYPTALSDLAALQRFISNAKAELPGAKLLAKELVTLPTHSRTSATEMRRAAAIVKGR
jgi:perosamine synthetase